MARLAKVRLRHKTEGRRKNVNAFDYARDISAYADWERIGETYGDATPEEENAAKIASNLEKYRKENPEESRKRGDARRAYEERTVSVDSDRGAEPVVESGVSDSPPVKDTPADDKPKKSRRKSPRKRARK